VCSLDQDVNKRAYEKLEGAQKKYADDNPACLQPQQKACYSMGDMLESTGGFSASSGFDPADLPYPEYPDAYNYGPLQDPNPNPTQGCEPWQTCCDGVCCNGNEACIKRTSGMLSSFFGVDSKGDPVGGILLRATNEWMYPDGSEPEDIPRVCSAAGRMGAGSAVKVIIFPVLLILALVVGAIMVLKTTGMSPMFVGLPAVAVIFCAILLCLTQYWPLAILTCLNAFVALGAMHKGGDFALYCLIPQALILAIICGGFGLGNLFVSSQGDSILFDVDRINNADCANYFNYFSYDVRNKPFKVDPQVLTNGLCSEAFLTLAVIATAVSIMFQVLMLVASGVEAISGSKM